MRGASREPTKRRTWCDLHEDPALTWPSWRALGGGSTSAGPAADHPIDEAVIERRDRRGVPGFCSNVAPVLTARSPESAARTLVAALRRQGRLGPYRRRLLIALYELADDDRTVGENSTDEVNVVADVGVIVELRRMATARAPLSLTPMVDRRAQS